MELSNLSDVWCYCCLDPEVFDSFFWITLFRSSCCKVVSVILLGTDWPFDLDLDAHSYLFLECKGINKFNMPHSYHCNCLEFIYGKFTLQTMSTGQVRTCTCAQKNGTVSAHFERTINCFSYVTSTCYISKHNCFGYRISARYISKHSFFWGIFQTTVALVT